MGIENIISINTMEIGRYAAFRRDRAVSPPVRKPFDTYEPSVNSSQEDRKALIASVRNKIKSGYYNSEEVVEDLSNSFAKVLDKLL